MTSVVKCLPSISCRLKTKIEIISKNLTSLKLKAKKAFYYSKFSKCKNPREKW
jgi:hypothetical protein